MQLKDNLKQPWGKFTDDDRQPTEGNNDKFIGEVHEVGGSMASEGGVGSHKEKDALTGSHQEEKDGSPSNFTFQLRRRS